MRLHTKLTYTDLLQALQRAKDAGRVTPDVTFQGCGLSLHGSRTHPRAFEVQLGTHDKFSLPAGYTDQNGHRMRVRRYKNSGDGGASSEWATGGCPVWAATWHEWGWFMTEVWAADPTARWGGEKGWGYKDRADFDVKTKGAFLNKDEPKTTFKEILEDMRRVERELAEEREGRCETW